jgi:hypothetical protein
MMGPAKIKSWFEKRAVRIRSVETLTLKGTPIVLGFQITTKKGKVGKVEANVRAHDLENREFRL